MSNQLKLSSEWKMSSPVNQLTAGNVSSLLEMCLVSMTFVYDGPHHWQILVQLWTLQCWLTWLTWLWRNWIAKLTSLTMIRCYDNGTDMLMTHSPLCIVPRFTTFLSTWGRSSSAANSPKKSTRRIALLSWMWSFSWISLYGDHFQQEISPCR